MLSSNNASPSEPPSGYVRQESLRPQKPSTAQACQRRLGSKALHQQLAQIRAVLDEALDLKIADVPQVIRVLSETLNQFRTEMRPADWRLACEGVLQNHPLLKLLHQDPFTLHAFSRPCGYAGDAKLLDYIYRIRGVPAGTTPLGRAIFEHGIERAQSSVAVRERRTIVAGVIDEVAAQRLPIQVMSIAAGHLREAGLSTAVLSRNVAKLVAFDQDRQSLATAEAAYGQYGVQSVHGSVRRLIVDGSPLRDFDLIYSTGLFDYLSDRAAVRLVRWMFDALVPGGRLVVANFRNGLPDTGFIEAFMRWDLVYRDPSELTAWVDALPAALVASQRTWSDSTGSIAYLEVCRV